MSFFKQLKILLRKKQKYSKKLDILAYKKMYVPFPTVTCGGLGNILKKWYPTGIKLTHQPTVVSITLST